MEKNSHLCKKFMEGKRVRIAGRFILNKLIGKGSFGVVYQASDSTTSRQVAVKLESTRASVLQLSNEAGVLKAMEGKVGFPQVYWYGTEGNYNILVSDLLSESLEKLIEKYNRFSLPTVVTCGFQMVERLQCLHEKNYIHRDLKPDNILVGLEDPSLTYLIDFGLARKYRDPLTKQHIAYSENRSLTGTARYASLNNHMGVEQSRRDDIEALLYILVYLFKGFLPWQGIKEKNKQVRYLAIADIKRDTSPKALCNFLPLEFCEILEYSRALRFDEAPNYAFLTGKLTSVGTRLRLELNQVDWSFKQPPRVSARAITRKDSRPRPHNIRRSRSTKHKDQQTKNRSNTFSVGKLSHRSESVETVVLDKKPFFKDRQGLKRLATESGASCVLW